MRAVYFYESIIIIQRNSWSIEDIQALKFRSSWAYAEGSRGGLWPSPKSLGRKKKYKHKKDYRSEKRKSKKEGSNYISKAMLKVIISIIDF